MCWTSSWAMQVGASVVLEPKGLCVCVGGCPSGIIFLGRSESAFGKGMPLSIKLGYFVELRQKPVAKIVESKGS